MLSSGISGVYPSRYDLREEGGVTPVRDQALAGSCWAFGSYGSLESYLTIALIVVAAFAMRRNE